MLFFLFHLIPAYILKKLIVDIEIVDKCENDYLGLCISEDLKNDGDKSRKFKIFLKKRNLNIIRTLAHELVHRKQAEQGRIDTNSGDTGSPIENEANAMAGILLRNFGKHHEDIYEHKK